MARDKTKRAKKSKEWRENNKEYINGWAKEYRKRNKEHIKAAQEEYRKYNKDKIFTREKERRDGNRAWFKDFVKSLKCSWCPEARWECLDFHHTNPAEKDACISSLYVSSKKRILEEFAKCVVLCANCHRVEHARLKRELMDRLVLAANSLSGGNVNTYTFTEQERPFIKRDYEWAKEHHISFNGLYAIDDIVSIDGCHIQFFIHEDTAKEVIEKAKVVAKRERDVVGFSCLIIPRGFPNKE